VAGKSFLADGVLGVLKQKATGRMGRNRQQTTNNNNNNNNDNDNEQQTTTTTTTTTTMTTRNAQSYSEKQ